MAKSIFPLNRRAALKHSPAHPGHSLGVQIGGKKKMALLEVNKEPVMINTENYLVKIR